jgi:hypothetical protein
LSKKEILDNPFFKITLPKAQKSFSNAVFGPLAVQKLHIIWLLVPSAESLKFGAVQKLLFGQP